MVKPHNPLFNYPKAAGSAKEPPLLGSLLSGSAEHQGAPSGNTISNTHKKYKVMMLFYKRFSKVENFFYR